MAERMRPTTRKRIRVIRIQRVIILVLLALLVLSLTRKPAAVSVDAEPYGAETSIVEALEFEALAQDEEIVTAEEPTPIFLGEFKTTAYCPCVKCCGMWSAEHPSRQGTGYIQTTSSGTMPTAGKTVAVDPSLIPFGTVLIIDGHEYVAEDTGSAVSQNIIDIYFDSHEDALKYGVQYKEVFRKGE